MFTTLSSHISHRASPNSMDICLQNWHSTNIGIASITSTLSIVPALSYQPPSKASLSCSQPCLCTSLRAPLWTCLISMRNLMLLQWFCIQTIITSVQQQQWQPGRAETKALQHLVAFPPNLKISNFIGSCILSPTVIWYMIYHDSVCFVANWIAVDLLCWAAVWLLECEGTGLQSPDSSIALDHTLHIRTRSHTHTHYIFNGSHTVTHTLYTITRTTDTIHLVLL